MPRRRARYEPHGLLALDPRAFGWLFDLPEKPEAEVRDGVAVVTIRGPLEHHDESYFWDSYEAIVERVAKALEGAPKAVVLAIDSPGGLVSGCFDTARQLRSMARAAGVPLYAFVDGMACSAAYALACSADRIFVGETSMTGSIGVIETLVDERAALEKWGLRVQLVTSGARKADGHPATEISSEVLEVAQQRTDQLAQAFFDLVAEMRGVDAEAVRSLEAGIVIGAQAVSLGLADELATFDHVLAIASGEENTMGTNASADMDDAIAKLRKAAESDDEEEAAKAKKMLAALEEDDSAEGDEEPNAEGDEEEEPAAEEEDEESGATASVKLAARIQSLEAKLAEQAKKEAKAAEDAERNKLLASRPDFAPEALEVLREAPLATVRNAVAKWPRGKVKIANPLAATANVSPTRGASQGAEPTGDHLPPDEARMLDERMGIRRQMSAVTHEGTSLALRTMTKEEMRQYAASRRTAPAAQ